MNLLSEMYVCLPTTERQDVRNFPTKRSYSGQFFFFFPQTTEIPEHYNSQVQDRSSDEIRRKLKTGYLIS